MLPPGTAEKFKFVRCSGDIDNALIPDFFAAGPNRTGSTWLHRQLVRHPEIHFATPKEIYYFSCLGQPNHKLHSSDDLEWDPEHFRITPEIRTRRQTQCSKDFGVDFQPKVQGEASASYAVGINPQRAADVLLLNPEVKVIIVARHPVERAWSHIKFDARLQYGPEAKSLAVEGLQEILHRNQYIFRCGLYTQMYEFWSKRLKPGHLLTPVFDRITQAPIPLLQEVAGFLGVDADARWFASAGQEGRNETPARDMPAEIEQELDHFYRDELKTLRDRLGVDWQVEPKR